MRFLNKNNNIVTNVTDWMYIWTQSWRCCSHSPWRGVERGESRAGQYYFGDIHSIAHLPKGSPELGLCRWQNQINWPFERWEFLPKSFRLSSLSFRWLGMFCFCESEFKSQQVSCRVCVYGLSALVSVTNTSVSSWQQGMGTKSAANQALLLIVPFSVP